MGGEGADQLMDQISSQTGRRGGVGILGVVLIVLVTLKLAGLVSWPWWAVLMPLWLGLGWIAFCVAMMLAGLLLLVLAAGLEDRARDRIEAAEARRPGRRFRL